LASIFNISSLIGFYIEDKDFKALEETKKMMDQKTDQILDLTDNLLNWARSQTEGLNPLFATLSLNEIFRECLELYRPIAFDKGITIECGEQNDQLIWADRNMARTVLRNLVNNAVKFTHKNGKISVWHQSDDRFVQIPIKDSGIGIERANLGLLFETNCEKMNKGTAGETCTGLGLSVCKEFVEAMQGKIWVESEVGQGSQFTFELLLYNPEIHPSKHKQMQKSVMSSPI
jgi:signal transduction histidine kinase